MDKKPVTSPVIDLEKFKHFNDTYRHQKDDFLLKEIAEESLTLLPVKEATNLFDLYSFLWFI